MLKLSEKINTNKMKRKKFLRHPLARESYPNNISCIDQIWETISQAVVSGELGATAQQ